MKKPAFMFLALVTSLAIAPAAWGDQYHFNVSGTGISASGTLTVTEVGASGVYEITGISGSYSNQIVSGTIAGLASGSYDSSNPSVQYDLSNNPMGAWDNLFYPSGDAPALSSSVWGSSASGGVFDMYGVMFYVSGGYQAVLWSHGAGLGYGLADAKLSDLTIQDYAYTPVTVETFPVVATPEPADSLSLLGAGLLGLIAVLRCCGFRRS